MSVKDAYVIRSWEGTYKRWALAIHTDEGVVLVDIGNRELDEPGFVG